MVPGTVLILSLSSLAQESAEYRLTGILYPDPQRTNRSVIDVSITIANEGTGPYK